MSQVLNAIQIIHFLSLPFPFLPFLSLPFPFLPSLPFPLPLPLPPFPLSSAFFHKRSQNSRSSSPSKTRVVTGVPSTSFNSAAALAADSESPKRARAPTT